MFLSANSADLGAKNPFPTQYNAYIYTRIYTQYINIKKTWTPWTFAPQLPTFSNIQLSDTHTHLIRSLRSASHQVVLQGLLPLLRLATWTQQGVPADAIRQLTQQQWPKGATKAVKLGCWKMGMWKKNVWNLDALSGWVLPYVTTIHVLGYMLDFEWSLRWNVKLQQRNRSVGQSSQKAAMRLKETRSQLPMSHALLGFALAAQTRTLTHFTAGYRVTTCMCVYMYIYIYYVYMYVYI